MSATKATTATAKPAAKKVAAKASAKAATTPAAKAPRKTAAAKKPDVATHQHEQIMKDLAADLNVGGEGQQGALFIDPNPVVANQASVAAAQATIETQTTIETDKETITMNTIEQTTVEQTAIPTMTTTEGGVKIEAAEVTTDQNADKTYVIVDDATKRVSVILKGEPTVEQKSLLSRTVGTMYELASDAVVKVGDLVIRSAVTLGEVTMTVLRKGGKLVMKGVAVIGNVVMGTLYLIGGGIVMIGKGLDSLIMGGFELTETVVGGTVNTAEAIIGGACNAIEEIGCAVGDTVAAGIDDIFGSIFGWISSKTKTPVAVAA